MQARLPAQSFDSIFAAAIQAPALSRTTRVDVPRAVFLGGQPGCGKSTCARHYEGIFGSANYVHVDVDRLRPFHPAYLPLLADPSTERSAPTAVQRDCSLWADRLRDCAIDGQRNVLIESTMRSPDQVRAASARLRAQNYAIDARVLAVHSLNSEVSLLHRFEHEKRALGFAREMPVDYHNLAAVGLVETVQTIEAEKLADHLLLLDRTGRTVYENRLVDGQWTQTPHGALALQDFRTASLDGAQKTNIARLWDDVLGMMNERHAPPAEIQAVQWRRDEVVGQLLTGPALATGDSGFYFGKILSQDDGVIQQKTGRDPSAVTQHIAHKLSRIPSVGEVVSISYGAGVGRVSERSLENTRQR